MSIEKTPNYNLNKPGYDNFGDIVDLNENADIIDEELLKRANKVTSPVEDNFAALTATGDIKNSGKKASDFGSATDVGKKANKIIGGITGNLVIQTSTGDIADSGKKLEDLPSAEAFAAHIGDTNNPHSVTPAQIGAVPYDGLVKLNYTFAWASGKEGFRITTTTDLSSVIPWYTMLLIKCTLSGADVYYLATARAVTHNFINILYVPYYFGGDTTITLSTITDIYYFPGITPLCLLNQTLIGYDCSQAFTLYRSIHIGIETGLAGEVVIDCSGYATIALTTGREYTVDVTTQLGSQYTSAENSINLTESLNALGVAKILQYLAIMNMHSFVVGNGTTNLSINCALSFDSNLVPTLSYRIISPVSGTYSIRSIFFNISGFTTVY